MSIPPNTDKFVTAEHMKNILMPYGGIPVVIRVMDNDFHKDFHLDVAQTSFDGKPGTETSYGCIDVFRVEIDSSISKSDRPITAMQLADEIGMDVPLKLLADNGDICFLFGNDVRVSRHEVDGVDHCLITVVDRDDA